MKATKYKANQASDEVRVENRNHGLCNKTKNSEKTVKLFQKLLQREGLLWDLKSPKGAQSHLKLPKMALSRLKSPKVALGRLWLP